MTSQLPDGGGGVASSSKTITTSPPLRTASVGCSRTAREVVAYVVAPSSTAAAGTGGGGAIDASAPTAAADTSSACDGASSMLGGWGQGSEEITRVLNARCFRGARLSMLVSVCLRKQRKATSANKSEESRQRRCEVGNLHLGAHPSFLHHAVQRAVLGGHALWARRLRGSSASTRYLNGGNTLPCALGAVPPASATVGVGLWPPPTTRVT
jgi:hypothetical protein